MPAYLAKDMQAFQDIWIHDLQPKEAALSTQGKQILVPDSDHMIPFERPSSIIDAARAVVNQIRSAPDSSTSAAQGPR